MKNIQYVEDTIFSAPHPYLYKHISVKQVLLSLTLALGGVVAILISLVVEDPSSALSMSLLVLGIVLFFFSFYRLFHNCSEILYQPTGSLVCRGTLFMDTIELQRIQLMLKTNDFSTSFRSSFKESGNARLDYMVSKDRRFVAVQLLHFVPYVYEPVSDRCYYTDADAEAIARSLNLR